MQISTSTKQSNRKCQYGKQKINNIKSLHLNKLKITGNFSFKIKKILFKTKNNGLLPKNSKNSNNKKYSTLLL
jgi:hypothetical protein